MCGALDGCEDSAGPFTLSGTGCGSVTGALAGSIGEKASKSCCRLRARLIAPAEEPGSPKLTGLSLGGKPQGLGTTPRPVWVMK